MASFGSLKWLKMYNRVKGDGGRVREVRHGEEVREKTGETDGNQIIEVRVWTLCYIVFLRKQPTLNFHFRKKSLWVSVYMMDWRKESRCKGTC